MAVDFLSSRMPPWKAIKTRLKSPPKSKSPIQVNEYLLNQRKIGPGTYSIPTLPALSTPHKFSSAPRFSNSEKLKLLVPFLEKKSPSQVIRGKMLYKQNFDPSPHRYQTKAARLLEQSLERSKSVSIAKQVKKMIQENKKIDLIEKFKKRDSKLMKWKAAKLYIQAEKGWILLVTCMFAVQAMNKKLSELKKIKSIFIFNSSLLYQVARAVGKIRIKVKKMRKDKAIKVMKNLFMPIFQCKLAVMLENYKNTIAFTVDFCLTRRLLWRILSYWRKKMTKFENGMMRLVVVHKHRIARLFEMWDEIQRKFNYYSAKAIFPKDVSLKILRKYLFEKLRKFYLVQLEIKNKFGQIKKEENRKSVFRTFQLTQRRSGLRNTIAVRSFMHLRIYNKDELIPLYLEEEAKLHIEPDLPSFRTSIASHSEKDKYSHRLSLNLDYIKNKF